MEYITIAVFIIAASLIWFLISKVDLSLIDDDCEHENTFTHVDQVTVTCETTTITCLDCHKRLSTKTDCR